MMIPSKESMDQLGRVIKALEKSDPNDPRLKYMPLHEMLAADFPDLYPKHSYELRRTMDYPGS